MKNTFALVLVCALCGYGAGVYAQEAEYDELPAAQLVRYSFRMPGVEKLPLNYSRSQTRMAGCEITYLLEGENFIYIPEGALEITSINNDDGDDITFDDEGEPTWKYMSAYSGVSDNRKKAVVSLFVKTMGPITVPVPHGYVTVKTARSIKTESVTMRTADVGKKHKLGPFDVVNFGGGPYWDLLRADDFPEAEPVGTDEIEADENDIPDPVLSSEKFNIHIRGETRLFVKNQPNVIDMEINAGGKTIRHAGGGGNHNIYFTYNFPYKPNTETFTFTLSYYDDVGEVVYKIGD